MNRLFSMPRRRPGFVDILTPFTYGVDGYRLKWSANFDGTFTTFITATNVGFVDPNINPYAIDSQPLGGSGLATGGRNVRIVFNPTSFTIPDLSSFWLQFVQVIGGVEQTPGAPTLVLPDSANHGVGIVTIRGQATAQASSANALQIDLPRLMNDFHIHNEGPTNPLFVSTEAGGAETQIPVDTAEQYAQLTGTQGSIWVRSSTAAVTFSARFSLAFPR